MRSLAASRGSKGVALLVVLWGCTLAAITLGALASTARVEGVQAQGQYRQARASYAAQAGIARAALRLRATLATQRWMADGRPYRFREGDIDVSVSIADEDGKFDLNRMSPDQLGALLKAIGVDPEEVPRLRDRIVGWGKSGKQFDDALLARGGFTSIEELWRVPGLDAAVADKLEPELTLWAHSGMNLAHASPTVVSAVTGVGRDAAVAYVEGVRSAAPDSNVLPPLPGDGVVASASTATSGTVTVSSSAVSNGLVVLIQATIILDNSPGDPRAYRVVRWRESVSAGDRAPGGTTLSS